MVNARSLSTLAQSSNASTVQLEKLYKQQLKSCQEILAKHEVVRGPVLQYLHDLGYSAAVESMPRKQSVETEARQQRAAAAAAKKAARPAMTSEEAKDAVPTKYNQLSALSATLLIERVLPALHPTVLSAANLTAMFCKKTGAAAKQTSLLCLLEFATGESPQFLLHGDMSKWSCKERQRITADMVLPPDYSTCGIYFISDVRQDCDELEVQHRYTSKKVVLDAKTFTVPPGSYDEVKITCNHSETAAVLEYADSSSVKRTVRLGGFFPEQKPIKRALAIKDGSNAVETPVKRLKNAKASPDVVLILRPSKLSLAQREGTLESETVVLLLRVMLKLGSLVVSCSKYFALNCSVPIQLPSRRGLEEDMLR
eukprot:2687202-Amphidinium_carterae.2